MNIKEFFKPTIGKIILFLIIPTFYAQFGEAWCAGLECSQYYLPLPLPLAILSYLSYPSQNNLVLSIFAGIVISYLLASIIIYAYKTIKTH